MKAEPDGLEINLTLPRDYFAYHRPAVKRG